MNDTEYKRRSDLAVATRYYGRHSDQAITASAEFWTERLAGICRDTLAKHPEIDRQQRARIAAAVLS